MRAGWPLSLGDRGQLNHAGQKAGQRFAGLVGAISSADCPARPRRTSSN
ncbi:MAG: hypothetical protein NVV62_14620 [Terricaulis sp.]|nr:hypothetical protein [Terricaulis sp.]